MTHVYPSTEDQKPPLGQMSHQDRKNQDAYINILLFKKYLISFYNFLLWDTIMNTYRI